MDQSQAVALFKDLVRAPIPSDKHPVAVWLAHCCVVDARARASSRDLYESFCAFYETRKGGIFSDVAQAIYRSPKGLTQGISKLSNHGVLGLALFGSSVRWSPHKQTMERVVYGLRLLW